VLGNPNWQSGLLKARAVKNPVQPAVAVVQLMRQHRDEGLTLRAIAERLNDLGLRTPKESQWYACTVSKAMQDKAA
jgi:hypothetical protein